MKTAVVMILILAMCAGALFGCGAVSFYSYENAQGYSAGACEIEEPIYNLDIDWLAGKVGLYDYAVDTLFDAEENIKMGCWYLGYLSRLFGGDPITVACAYHAGQGNVRDHWLPKYSSNGRSLTLDEIPMNDTKYYAGKVLEAYAIYQQHHYKTPDSDAGIMPAL